jgi:hypothetical protein
MAKQIEDTKTLELPALETKRGRGRPATGKAKTPAQRKRDQRFRDHQVAYSDDMTSWTLDALFWDIRGTVRCGYSSQLEPVFSELRRRALANSRDSH